MNDQELKRLFDEARCADGTVVPPFDELMNNVPPHTAPPSKSLNPRLFGWLRTAVAASALIVFATIAVWHRFQTTTDAETDLKTIDEVCSLLIERLDSRNISSLDSTTDEMEWATATDSLLTFNTFRFDKKVEE